MYAIVIKNNNIADFFVYTAITDYFKDNKIK